MYLKNVDNIWNILNDEKTILESIDMIFQFDKIYDDDTYGAHMGPIWGPYVSLPENSCLPWDVFWMQYTLV